MIEFMSLNPGWTFLYLAVIGFVIVGVVEAVRRR